MNDTNTVEEPEETRGRPTLPKEEKRQSLDCRVDPTTLKIINDLAKEYGSQGRAVDSLAATLRHQRNENATTATSKAPP